MNTKETMLPNGALLREGTYRVEEQLSSGGFGNTYKVTDLRFNKTRALKEFFMKGLNWREGQTVTVTQPDNHPTFESQRRKFRKEAQRLYELHNDHIVRVHDLFDANGTSYYVMDFVDGESLADRLKRTNKPLSEAEVLRIISEVLDALKAVHNLRDDDGTPHPLLHLDIKPANIMIDSKGRSYLIDFGASKQMSTEEREVSTSTAMSYTQGYAPSEQVNQNRANMGPWTDLYALGATAYKLLTNNQPPLSDDMLETGALDLNAFPDGISKSTRELVQWMMRPARTLRPQTVEAVEARMKGVAASTNMPQNDEATLMDVSPKKQNAKDEETIVSAPEPVLQPKKVVQQPQPKPEPQKLSTPKSQQPEKKRGKGMIVLLFILLAVVGAGAYFIANSDSESSGQSSSKRVSYGDTDDDSSYSDSNRTEKGQRIINNLNKAYAELRETKSLSDMDVSDFLDRYNLEEAYGAEESEVSAREWQEITSLRDKLDQLYTARFEAAEEDDDEYVYADSVAW